MYMDACQFELMNSGLEAYKVCLQQENIDAQYRLVWGGLIIVGVAVMIGLLSMQDRR
jgi:hypothetical protein